MWWSCDGTDWVFIKSSPRHSASRYVWPSCKHSSNSWTKKHSSLHVDFIWWIFPTFLTSIFVFNIVFFQYHCVLIIQYFSGIIHVNHLADVQVLQNGANCNGWTTSGSLPIQMSHGHASKKCYTVPVRLMPLQGLTRKRPISMSQPFGHASVEWNQSRLLASQPPGLQITNDDSPVAHHYEPWPAHYMSFWLTSHKHSSILNHYSSIKNIILLRSQNMNLFGAWLPRQHNRCAITWSTCWVTSYGRHGQPRRWFPAAAAPWARRTQTIFRPYNPSNDLSLSLFGGCFLGTGSEACPMKPYENMVLIPTLLPQWLLSMIQDPTPAQPRLCSLTRSYTYLPDPNMLSAGKHGAEGLHTLAAYTQPWGKPTKRKWFQTAAAAAALAWAWHGTAALRRSEDGWANWSITQGFSHDLWWWLIVLNDCWWWLMIVNNSE